MTVERHRHTRGYGFWKWVLDYAKRQCRERWEFQDRLCPHCLSWSSEIGGHSTSSVEGSFGYIERMFCVQCQKESLWHNEGICAWTVDETGKALKGRES